MNFLRSAFQSLKVVFLPLFFLGVLSNNLDYILSMQLESALRNPEGAQIQMYFYGFTSLISGFLFPIFSLSFCLYAFSKPFDNSGTLEVFLKKNLNQILIETMRVWGKTVLWSLFFIIPGIWKFIEYSLVPFFVSLSREYDEGRVDALQASTKTVRQNFLVVTCIVVGFHFLLPAFIAVVFDSYRLIWKTPIASLLLSLLDTYLVFISSLLLYNVFKTEVKTNEQSHI